MNVEKASKESSASPLPKPAALDNALVWVLAIVALALRWPQMHESLWIDELHTSWAVSEGIGELFARTSIGNQSPVWFLLPWLSSWSIGLSEVALRLPSLFAGVLIVPLVYRLTSWWSASRTAAVVAAVLVMCDEQCISFSAEARPYAWVQLIGVLQVMAFWYCLGKPNWKTRAAWVGWSCLLFYLHYTAILLVCAEVAFAVGKRLVSKSKQPYSLAALGTDLLLLGLTLTPATSHVLEVAARRENWKQFVAAPSAWDAWAIFPLAAYLIVPTVLAYGWILIAKTRGVTRPLTSLSGKFNPILFCLCWLFVPLMIVWITTITDIAALWMARYVIVSAAALPILAGLLCSLPDHKTVRIVTGTLTVLAAIVFAGPQWSWWQYGQAVPPRGEDWRAAVAYINADKASADQPILLRPDLIEADALPQSDDPLLREYCLLPIRSIYSTSRDRISIPLSSNRPGDIAAADIDRLRNAHGLWIVTRGRAESAEATFKLVLRTLAREGLRPQTKNTQTFGSVWVMQVEFAEAE